MKKLNSLLNGRVAHLKSFPGLKGKPLKSRNMSILEEYEYGAAILRVSINDLLLL